MKKESSAVDYRRRDLLTTSLRIVAYSALLGGVVPGAARAFAAPASVAPASTPTSPSTPAPTLSATAARFFDVSCFLTSKHDLSTVTSRRTYDAMIEADPTFATRFTALQAALQKAQLNDMSAFDASPPGQDAALRATAVEIVSAWYLGRVGKGPNARLVGYHDALMYRPTAGITTVPTYQLGGYGYWATKPPTA